MSLMLKNFKFKMAVLLLIIKKNILVTNNESICNLKNKFFKKLT